MRSILYPFITEKAMSHLEHNQLQIISDFRSSKSKIKKEMEKLYGYEVRSVNTMTTMKGQKKAIITFENKEAASEIATRLGLL